MKKTLVFAMIMIMMLSITVFAGDNNGQSPLMVKETIPADGAEDIPIDQEIKLSFSNNVINTTIRENNMACLQLVDSDGNNVDMKIFMADDQIHPDQKRDIIITPAANLAENMTYTLKINGDLSGKNGNTLGEELTVSFSTISTGIDPAVIAVAAIFLIALIVVIIKRSKAK
jgi:methionine-rich copper-binding protein CopC